MDIDSDSAMSKSYYRTIEGSNVGMIAAASPLAA